MEGYKIKIGATVKDIITGFTGIVMARTEYMTGCITLGISVSKIPKEGKIPDWEWIDETRCVVIKSKIIILKKEETEKEPGGDMPHPGER